MTVANENEVKTEKKDDALVEIESAADQFVKNQSPEGDAPEGEGNTDQPSGEAPEDQQSEMEDAPSDEEDGTGDESDDGSEEPPAVDDALVERAVRAGLTMEDARKSPASVLEAFIKRAESDAESGKPDDGSNDGEEEKDPLEGIPELDSDEYDKELVNTFSSLRDIVRKQHEELTSLRKSGTPEDSESVESAEFIGWLNAQVSALGEDYHDLFGKGPYSKLEDEKARAARDVLIRHMDVAEEDAKALGRNVPEREELFKAALSSAFGDKLKEIKGKELAKKAASRRTVNQPRDAKGKFSEEPSDPIEAATNEIQKFFEES